MPALVNLLLLAAVFPGAGLPAAESAGPVRLAVVSNSEDVTSAADALTVELSKDRNLQIFERDEIARVLREQALASGNPDYVKLGRILGADGLLLLGMTGDETNRQLSARLVGVKPGVVLTSGRFAWSNAGAMDWAKGFASHFAPFWPKLTVLSKDAVPISVVGLRSAVNSAEARDSERQLTLLTIDRLSRQREVFALERRRLELLAREKDFASDESAFWSGAYLLEGDIDRDGYSAETMTLHARLVPAGGSPPVTLEVIGARTNVAGLVDELVQKVVASLGLKSVRLEWNASDEGGRYLREAQWAYRWGLFPDAQAAAESAWALGVHTRELAALRIRSYSDAATVRGIEPCAVSILAIPDAGQLLAASRALELFNGETTLGFSKEGDADAEWFLVGFGALRAATEQLGSFHNAAEARPGHETRLLELRALARQAAATLQKHNLAHRETVFSRALHCGSLDELSWQEGGIWFDRPEDAMPMCRRLLETGCHPTKLPSLAGWTWADRKRIPALRNQLIQEFCQSTQATVRLEGLYLALLNTPRDSSSRLEAREQELLATVWEQRKVVWSDFEFLSILPRVESALKAKYGYGNGSSYDREPFIGFRHQLRKAYMLESESINSQVVHRLFFGDANYSPAEATELLPLLEARQAKQPDSYLESAIVQARSQAGAARKTDRPPPSPLLPGEEPVTAAYVPWELKDVRISSTERWSVRKLLVRGDRLWALIQREPYFEPDVRRSWYVAIDPETGRCDSIGFPPQQGFPDEGFDVMSGSLFVSVQNRLVRYRLKEKTWESIPVPLERGADVVGLGGKLYLGSADGLLELTPDTREIRVLVSSRRQPPVNDVDPRWDAAWRVVPRSDGKLDVVVAGRCGSFSPSDRAWGPITETPAVGWRGRTFVFPSGQGAVMLLAGGGMPVRIFALPGDGPADLLLAHAAAMRGSSAGAAPMPSTRWEWPQVLSLEYSCFLLQPDCLWVLNPTRFQPAWLDPFQPARFSDDRHATLARFTAGEREAVLVPIRFESSAPGVEPFSPRQAGLLMHWTRSLGVGNTLFWCDTPRGFVFGGPGLAGHWFIRKEAVESRIEARRRRSVPNGEAPSLPADASSDSSVHQPLNPADPR